MQTKHKISKRAAASVLVVGVLTIISAQFARAYVTSDFSSIDSGRAAAHPGNTNIELGHFTGPNPAVDSLVVNGEGEAVAAGDPLSSFAENELYVPTAGVESAGYDAAYPIINSANMTLDAADTVLTNGVNALNGFGTSESSGVTGFLDLNGNSDRDPDEDIVKAVITGNSSALVNGTTISLFPQANSAEEKSYFYLATNANKTIDPLNPPAIFDYTNSVIELGPTINVIRAGSIGFHRLNINDPICITDNDSNNSLSPEVDDIWWDAAGDCATFDTGIDVSVVGGAPMTGANMHLSQITLPPEFGPITLGYSDGNSDGHYNCSRGGACEAIVIMVGNADFQNGALATVGESVLMLYGDKNDAVDGVYAVSDYPSKLPNVSGTNAVLLGHELLDGENKYAFVDTNEDGLYQNGEDILELVTPGGAGVVNNGQAFKYFPASTKYLDSANPTYSGLYEDGEAIISSADTNLDVGPLDGSGTDDLLVDGTAPYFTAIQPNFKYYDSNSSGSLEPGDDIVNDSDLSAYYNAADLLSLEFNAATTDYPVEDQDISVINIYRMVGETCAGSGTDISLSGTEDAPYFGRTYAIFDDPFTTPQTYCIYADISPSARGGRYLQLSIPQDGLAFSGGMTAPTDAGLDFSGFGHYMTITKYIDSTLTQSTRVKSATASYTFAFTTSASLVSGDLVYTLFPDEYDVSGASIVCTDDGSASAGSSSINGQILIRTLSAAIDASSDVECTVSGVKNPNAIGDYTSFQILTVRQTELGATIGVDSDVSFSAVSITAPASTPRGGGGSISAPATPSVSITAPAASATIASPVTITWSTAGQEVSFADLVYAVNGQRYYIAHNIPNTGSYSWSIPGSLAGKLISLSVELTDLSSSLASTSIPLNISASVVGNPDVPAVPVGNSACNGYSWSAPDLSASLVKAPSSPTVYYLAPDNMLRPFFNESLFKSWNLKFSDVRTIPMAQLSQYPLGSPMAPLPGSTLVKSPLDNKVYALEPNDANPARPYLHWIASEEVAKAYFGDTWASKIIDVVPSIIVMSPKGGDLTNPTVPPCYIGLYK